MYQRVNLPEEADLAGVDSGVADWTLEAAGCRLAAAEEGTLAAEGWLPADYTQQRQQSAQHAVLHEACKMLMRRGEGSAF